MVKIKGFTLIELMIVVAIIGILAAMIIPAFEQGLFEKNAAVQDYDSPATENTININGVEHVCDSFGQCRVVD